MKTPTVKAVVNWMEQGREGELIEYGGHVWSQVDGGDRIAYTREGLEARQVFIVKRVLRCDGREILSYTTESGPRGAEVWKAIVTKTMEVECE